MDSLGGRMIRDAVFSDEGRYRYRLLRVWDPSGKALNVIGMNPSIADAVRDDPTATFCTRLAASWGFGSLVMTNLYALVSTQPEGLHRDADPVGPANDRHLVEAAAAADRVIAGWGVPDAFRRPRVRKVLQLMRKVDLWAVGLTNTGHPHHPSRMSYPREPVLYRVRNAGGRARP